MIWNFVYFQGIFIWVCFDLVYIYESIEISNIFKKRERERGWWSYFVYFKKYDFFFFLKKVSTYSVRSWWYFFIIRPRYQSIFDVDWDWTPDLLFNHQRSGWSWSFLNGGTILFLSFLSNYHDDWKNLICAIFSLLYLFIT